MWSTRSNQDERPESAWREPEAFGVKLFSGTTFSRSSGI
jgi:hypothetical protein